MKEVLNHYMELCGISLTDRQSEQFIRYYQLLTEWNSFMNLTAITEFNEVVLKHFVDSVSLSTYLPLQNESLIDVGTGAGFPGIPLKILYPEIKLTLLDSLNKRIRFLDTVTEELGLTNVTTIHGRAEDFAKPDKLREQFDLAVSRAVANLATLSEYCLPYVKKGGLFVAYKTDKSADEIDSSKSAVDLLGGTMEKNIEFSLADTEIGRSFIFIRKQKSTPTKYPRKSGLPAKEPLE